MTIDEQREAARQFIIKWSGKGKEDEDDCSFWLDIFQRILGVSEATDKIDFQKKVLVSGNTKSIDAYISDTKIIIEQKSLGKALDKKYHNSGDIELTPYEQAKRYNDNLPYDEKVRYIVTSNFAEIWVYDMNVRDPEAKIEKIKIEDLQTDFYRLNFLVKKDTVKTSKELELSIQAGDIVGVLYDQLYNSYAERSDEVLKSLNVLCVRLVFCMYAEDAGLFGKKSIFHDYLKDIEPRHMRGALKNLFRILDTPENERDKDEDEDLLEFPYVNGGLFSDENIKIPQFTEELKDILLEKASDGFDWSEISPTIFGAIFESTLNPETRRTGGMHYTSIENIHKVIDPLFLDDLKTEFGECKAKTTVGGARTKALQKLQEKLASLTFLDPASGSGNFLTESYISLRKLENEILKELKQDVASGQLIFGFINMDDMFDIKVSIQQFYGIEINDFAVTVSKTALWIAEAQMMKETLSFVDINARFLPLKSYVNIREDNSLTTDWNQVLHKSNCKYVMGNPPFVGARMMEQGSSQKNEIESLFGKIKDVQDLDYVTGWYKKAAEYIQGTTIEVGFVSTNSICQGAQVPILWNVMLNDYNVKINFAHQTFEWSNEANSNAHVYVIIVGFSIRDRERKRLFTYRKVDSTAEERIVNYINPYLLPIRTGYVSAEKNALCDVPKMNFGNQPRDGGHFILNKEEREELLKKEPELEKWIRKYVGADEFIKGKERWCLWLKNARPNDIAKSHILYHKVEAVKEFRLNSKAKTTKGYAKVPHMFAQITQPENVSYLIIPSVSSERRRYVPIGFVQSDVIASNAVQIVPNASLFHFGVLTSNVHMAWMRTVCGRLEMRYRYSKELVYNTFPWPDASKEQIVVIEQTAQDIINVRKKYEDTPFEVLYDPNLMPSDLSKAHDRNNVAVMKAYGFNIKDMSEADCVVALMERYQRLISS